VTIAAWCYRDAFDLLLVAALVEGYVAERPLSPASVAPSRVEGALGCLRFATSRITDFELRAREGERPARDFRRFLARLDAIATGNSLRCWNRRRRGWDTGDLSAKLPAS
jgi:Ser/Thr protein kinase RdoA (MazF antagonist)